MSVGNQSVVRLLRNKVMQPYTDYHYFNFYTTLWLLGCNERKMEP